MSGPMAVYILMVRLTMYFGHFRDKKGRRKTVQQASQMRKGAPDSKDGEKKREKTSDKMSGTRSVAQLHEHSGGRGTTAPSVISERSDSCDLPGIHFKHI